MPVQQSKEEFNYRELEEVVTKLSNVNDPAECAVKAAGDRIGSVGSKNAFQATLLTLEKLRRLSSNIKHVTSYLCVVPPCVSLEFPSPPILASLSFLSAVWNGSVV